MSGLNLPSFELQIKKQNNKAYIYDRLRKRYVRMTPEEYVRQHFIHFLIEHKGYPESLLANEISINLGNLKKRCDTVLYDRFLHPVLIAEYKSPIISINQDTFDQIIRYNMKLKVNWLVLSNGLVHYCCRIFEDGTYRFEPEIPSYETIRNT